MVILFGMKLLDKILRDRVNLVFLDFEATQFTHEMIAYGAVKVTLNHNHKIRKIHKGVKGYVRPKAKIGSFVTNLTGIDEKLLKEKGVNFAVALNDIKKYCGKNFSKTLFVTFGDQDVKIIHESLSNSMGANKEDARFIMRNTLDLAKFMNQFIKDENNQNNSLSDFLTIFNLKFEGKEHDPLSDALNLAYVYKAFTEEKDIVLKEYIKVIINNKKVPNPIRKVVKLLCEGETVTIKDLHSFAEDDLK